MGAHASGYGWPYQGPGEPARAPAAAAPAPVLVALGAFVRADGVIGYRWIHEGALADPHALPRFHAVLALLAALVLAAFLLSWPEAARLATAATAGE